MQPQSNQSRRDFFVHMTALGVAGILGSQVEIAGDLLEPAATSSIRLDALRPEDFAKHVGQTFIIHDGDRCVEAELAQIQRGPRQSGNRRQPFSVYFRLAGDESLPHRIYTVEHALMGRFDLFLGTVGQSTTSVTCVEAVFA